MKLNPVSLLNSTDDFEEVLKIVEEKLDDIELVQFDKYINEGNKELYYWLKSYRSNLTEGNTTTDDSFTKIIFNENEDNLYSSTFDEQYEIVNLKKAYSLFSLSTLNINTIQSVNRVLGNKIFKNKFMEYRGRFRNKRVYIPFSKNKEEYEVEFTRVDNIKKELEQLITNYNKSDKDNKRKVFALCIILHNELIGIHPFVEGNGRTTRVIMEMELEKYNIFPYIPYEYEKREYQQAMSNFSLDAQKSIVTAYENFTEYIVKNYIKNVDKMTGKLKKIEKLK